MAGYWPSSFFAFLWTEAKSRSMKRKKRTRPISSHLDRTSLVNKGFIIWLYVQVKTTTTKQNRTDETALLGKKFLIAGRCKIYFQCIFGLACNRGKQGILNYLRALTL